MGDRGSYPGFYLSEWENGKGDGEAYLYTVTGFWADLEFIIDTETHNWTTANDTRTLVCDFGEVTVYDAVHFRYKGQNYVVAGEKDFSALFE